MQKVEFIAKLLNYHKLLRGCLPLGHNSGHMSKGWPHLHTFMVYRYTHLWLVYLYSSINLINVRFTMKVRKKKRDFFGLSKIALDLPSRVYEVNRYAYPHSSPEEAMRSDWERVGKDFRVALDRAYEKATD